MSGLRPLTATAVLCGALLGAVSAQSTRRPPDAVVMTAFVHRDGVPEAGLGPDDFELTRSNRRQPLESVSASTLPVDVTVVIDSSPGGVPGGIDLQAGIQRVRDTLRPSDRIRLLGVGDSVMAGAWQQNTDALSVPAVPGVHYRLSDAVFSAVLHDPGPDRRHAVLVVTTGLDSCSTTPIALVRDAARRSSSVLYLIRIGNPAKVGVGTVGRCGIAPFRFANEDTWRMLPAIVEESGGWTYGRDRPDTDVTAVMQAMLDEFRSSYLIRFRPEPAPPGWQRLTLRVARKGLRVRARTGYFVDGS